MLRQHVRTDQLLGVEAVPVGEGTYDVAEESGADAPPVERAEPQAAAEALPVLSGSVPKLVSRPREEKAALLAAMDRDEVKGCTRCGLCQSRTNTVFGEGDPDAKIMFIGEGPGQNEDLQGRPFVGRAGELLDKMIAAMGLRREDVFIANVVKCRPPQNRTPTPMEADACWPYLRRQIEIVAPQVIVTLGGPATKTILQTTEGITRIRGQWRQYNGVEPPIPVMPTFHPAYLLRSYTVENRKKVWSDLQAVMKKVAE